MTYYNPPPNPFDPRPAQPLPMAPGRPAIINGLAITGIVLAIVWLLCVGVSLLVQLMTLAGANLSIGGGAGVKTAQLSPHVAMIGIVESVFSLALAIVLLVASIGALRLKGWARSTLIAWSVVVLLYATIQLVLQITIVAPETMRVVKESMPNTPMASQTATATQASIYVGAGVAWLVTCVLPVLFLIYWRGEKIRAWFNSDPAPLG